MRRRTTARRSWWAALACLSLGASWAGAQTAEPNLIDYAKRPDPAFAWIQVSNHDLPQGKVHHLRLTSQTWQGNPWVHQVRVYEPKSVKYDRAMLLFITGGATDSEPKPEDHLMGFLLAQACQARVAMLPQVPNQPLLDGKKEDDLISETFTMYLKTQDPTLPLLQPMAKSAIAAMDALQAWGNERQTPIDKFVVTGASKRGWTTWLTGAIDSGDRVIAIAPMVIPTLRFKAQMEYQLASWGKLSEQIEDYTRRGLTDEFETPLGRVLWRLVDPYSYLPRIKVPVVQINGTNDRYWTLDSVNLYWDDIPGQKALINLPNAGHNLAVNRNYALDGVGAVFRHAASGRALPQFGWKFTEGPAPALTLTLPAGARPKAVQLWTADAPTKDFREAKWTARAVELPGADEPTVTIPIERAADGFRAGFADLTFEIDGLAYHLSTQIRIFAAQPAE